MLSNYYIQSRLKEVDLDFLEYEELMLDKHDREVLESLAKKKSNVKQPVFNSNPHNSILLYVLGLVDDFNFEAGRSKLKGGAVADIDVDYDAKDRHKVIKWVIEKWGRERVANIGTFGTLKPKSLVRSFFRLSDTSEGLEEALAMIPEPKFGKEATLEEVVNGNTDKNYLPHPEITSGKFKEMYKTASKLEDLINSEGVHAAGLIISDFDISDVVPLRTKTKTEPDEKGNPRKVQQYITQFDMDEVQELGLIKYDFLSIDNLSIVKECLKLINEHTKLEVKDIKDFDKKTYELLAAGYMVGIFQMENSGIAKNLIAKIKPETIEELSDISSLNRPGPLGAGFDKIYLENKENGYPPEEMPKALHELLKKTHYTLIYQEQIMTICNKLAGFSLRDSDEIRRSMGKKKKEVLEPWKNKFIENIVSNGNMTQVEAEAFWADLLGYSDYVFNKSHSVSYSFITYWCAYLKANYPLEFFCALMSIRSQSMQPELWAIKAPQYLSEARRLDVAILPPNINKSELGFCIKDGKVYFGFNGIREVGKVAARSIIKAASKTGFSDLVDFLSRVDKTKVTRKTFTALVKAGCFDTMGYQRKELLDNVDLFYDKFSAIQAYLEREQLIKEETPKLEAINKLIDERDVLREKLKNSQKKKSPGESLTISEELKLSELEELKLKRKQPLKSFENPGSFPELTRSKKLQISLAELMEQAKYVGCYLQKHPAHIVFSDTDYIADCELRNMVYISGAVMNTKTIITKKTKQPMMFLEIGDETGIAEITIFPRTYESLKQKNSIPEIDDIIKIQGKCDGTDPTIKVIADKIQIYRKD